MNIPGLPGLAGLVRRVQSTNAVNPILLLCVVLGLPGLFLAAYGAPESRLFFQFVVLLCILMFAVGYLFFMLKDPNRLQSETYQIEVHRMHEAAKGIDHFPRSETLMANDRVAAIGYENNQSDLSGDVSDSEDVS